MAQFDVFENGDPKTKERVPYFLDIQNDLLNRLTTRVVIPLISDLEPITHLNPVFTVRGKKVTLTTQEMAAIPESLCRNRVASLAEQRETIIAAIDFLVTGF